MTSILAAQSADARAKGEALIQTADKLLAESWNERMWSGGEPIDPSPTIDQAINGGYSWLQIAHAARRPATSIWRRLATRRPRSSTIWRAVSAAASVLRPGAGRQLRCCSWRSARARPLGRPDLV